MLINDFLKDVKSVAVSGHVRPDGDCVGSSLSVYGYIKRNFPRIDVDVFLEKPTDKLAFLKDFTVINSDYEKDCEYDLMICVDCASKERLGKAVKYFDSAKLTVNIDHHVSNTKYADQNFVFGGLSSCCEALYGFMEPDRLDRDIAIALYTGIIYDTGVFKYEATTPKTMRIAADLMEFGIPTNFIVDESFYAKSYNENRIMGYAVEKSRLSCDGRVIYSYITRKELEEFDVLSTELEGIVSQLRLTKDIQVAIFMHEISEDEYKVSFRSNELVDVNEVAMGFGGGGHIRASGCTVHGEPEECMDTLLKATEPYLK